MMKVDRCFSCQVEASCPVFLYAVTLFIIYDFSCSFCVLPFGDFINYLVFKFFLICFNMQM